MGADFERFLPGLKSKRHVAGPRISAVRLLFGIEHPFRKRLERQTIALKLMNIHRENDAASIPRPRCGPPCITMHVIGAARDATEDLLGVSCAFRTDE
jgi:hypothetical protein